MDTTTTRRKKNCPHTQRKKEAKMRIKFPRNHTPITTKKWQQKLYQFEQSLIFVIIFDSRKEQTKKS